MEGEKEDRKGLPNLVDRPKTPINVSPNPGRAKCNPAPGIAMFAFCRNSQQKLQQSYIAPATLLYPRADRSDARGLVL